MNRPNAEKHHNPDPDYLRSLIEDAGFSQLETARRIGVSGRAIRHYLAGDSPIPYTVQFTVEQLCKQRK